MRRLAVIAIVAGLAGCVTPSIPIPPPDPAKMTFHISMIGRAVFTYPPTSAYVGGTAYIYDRTKGLGVIQDCGTDGSIGPTQEFPAALGDNVVVTVQVGEQAESQCIVLQEGLQNPTVYCP
jgi:hypothetical protein